MGTVYGDIVNNQGFHMGTLIRGLKSVTSNGESVTSTGCVGSSVIKVSHECGDIWGLCGDIVTNSNARLEN
jgi:hypothetical protein